MRRYKSDRFSSSYTTFRKSPNASLILLICESHSSALALNDLTPLSWLGATLFKVIYDIDVLDTSNKYLQLTEKALEAAAEALIPGRFLVDVFPFLRYLPGWFPGAGFKQKAAQWKVNVVASSEAPFRAAQSLWVSVIVPQTGSD